MVQLMIRLQNHGKKNHPYWWIVIQAKNKNFRGRILERVGIWAPRKTKTVDRAISVNKYKIKYWLSVGATPTDGAHRLLFFAGLLPKKPVPFGSKYLYTPMKKPYSLQYFHKHRWGLDMPEGSNVHHYDKIKQMENILKAKLEIDKEAINEIVRPRDLKFKATKTEYNTDMNTDDINSDDFEFYSRKRNFDIISKKLNNYFEHKFKLYRGNDYKYNNYLRKLEKLSKFESLDYEGFKEYLECVKNLNDSKSKALENIGQHFLNELFLKENMSKEISEMIKIAKLNFDKNDVDEVTGVNENKKFFDVFSNSAKKDTSSIIEALSKSFQSAAKDFFKVKEDESFTDKEFQDIKNLRIAKIVIKLRVALLNKERKEYEKDNEESGQVDKEIYKKKFNKSENDEGENSNNLFTSVFDSINSSKFEDMPLFDKEMIEEIVQRNSECDNYDDLLFQNINNTLLSTSTFQKFKPLLFNEEFYGTENISNEDKAKILTNPNIYLLNNDLIDELINSLLFKLKKKYEVNDIYRDEETDLNKFETDEKSRFHRRREMEAKISELKKKHGNIDLLYANFAPEDMKDIYEFRRDYGEDYAQKYDVKFKRDFRIVKPEYAGGKYFTAEEIDEAKALETKSDLIRERVQKEFEMIKLGMEIPKQEVELSEEEKKIEQEIRYELELKILGPQSAFDNIIPLPEENRPAIDFNPYISIFRRRHKKDPKAPHQDEILKLNKKHLRQNIILANSVQETRAISVPRQKEMVKRFVELFGRYSDTLYPDGFRHYENFEIYNSLFPTKSVADYQTELHTFCDFDTFVEICYGSINHIKKIGLMALEFPELFDRAQYLSTYIASKNSEFITKVLKDFYKGYLVNFEKKDLKFKIIDALEQAAAYNMADTTIPELKTLLRKSNFEENLGENYTFNKFQLMSFPNLEERGEDTNLSRQSPFMPINPLKAHKANPTFNTPLVPKKSKFNFHRGRLRMYKGFCTMERFNTNH